MYTYDLLSRSLLSVFLPKSLLYPLPSFLIYKYHIQTFPPCWCVIILESTQLQCLLLCVLLLWHPGICGSISLLVLAFGVLLTSKSKETACCRRKLWAYHKSHGRSDTFKEGTKPGITLLRQQQEMVATRQHLRSGTSSGLFMRKEPCLFRINMAMSGSILCASGSAPLAASRDPNPCPLLWRSSSALCL